MFPSIKNVTIVLLLINSACAHAETTVALTTTVHADATAEDKTLMQGLLPLLELAVGKKEGLQVVEREAVAAILAELARSLSLGAGEVAQLQVGQMDEANLIVAVELSSSKEPISDRFAVVRITEAATAVVRGVTAVPISAALIEETTAEIADYVATIAKGPNLQVATIAVLPFESVERFDRLRPLERGLRDLFASILLRQKTCRVVQRSSMEQLLTELDFVRAGLTAGGRGLEGAPSRQATYVLRGEIDERTSSNGNLIVLVAELVEVKSRQVVIRIERACKQQDLVDKVAEIAGQISQIVATGDDELAPPKDAGVKEIDRLYELALRDVFRFIRHNPYDASYHIFRIPGIQRPSGLHPRVEPDTPLGAHLLQKSIDRLESVLFLEPERLTAALPLAYCLSFHVEGIWRPERCEQLLRQILAKTNSDKMQEATTWWLGAMYFPHRGRLYSAKEIAEVDPKLIRLGFDRQLEAFAYLPRGGRWAQRYLLLNILETICTHTEEEQQWSALMNTIAQTVGQPATRRLTPVAQNELLKSTSVIAANLVRTESASTKLRTEAESLLRKWRSSDDRWCRLHGAKQLMLLNRADPSEQEFDAILDEIFTDATDPYVQQSQTVEKTVLARRLRTQGNLEAALQVLKGFQPKDHTGTFGRDYSYCNYGYQLGLCYEGLGRKREALETYLNYAEMPFGYHGSNFSKRIDALGGVPLRKNRDINVRYPELTKGKPFYCRVLTTDGEQLFCAGGFLMGRVGPKAVPIRSVRALHLATGKWSNLGGPDDRVSCLTVAEGYLWAGTDNQGLWRLSLANGQWRRWTTDDGLPTNSIVAVEAHGPVAYASIGNINPERRVISGGVVRVDPSAKSPSEVVHIYRDDGAPQTAPGSMTIHNSQLVVRGLEYKLRLLDLKTDKWRKLLNKASPVVGSGPSGIWFAPTEQIASLLGVNGATSKSYRAASLLKDYPAGNYFPKFFVEHDGQLWIGGFAWRRFGDSGLFRLNLATGELTRHGPRDGFRYDDNNRYQCFDGVWAKGRLWVATSFGLAEVSMRDPSERETNTPIEEIAESINSSLPAGWAVSIIRVGISLRRDQKVLWLPVVGRPPRNAGETESEYLRRVGTLVNLDLHLRFVLRLTTAEYQQLSGRHPGIMQRGKNGFHDKAGLSRYFRLKEQYKLPVYFTPDHSVFIDGVPPPSTMHDDAAHQEMREIFAKLKTLLQPYDGADPLLYSQPSKLISPIEERSAIPLPVNDVTNCSVLGE